MRRGKIERVFETIQRQFLVEVTGDEAHLARHPVSSLEELNDLLDHWGYAPSTTPGCTPRPPPGQRPRHRHLGTAARQAFSDDAVRAIHARAHGLPRAINRLAITSLLAACAAGKNDRDTSSTSAPPGHRRAELFTPATPSVVNMDILGVAEHLSGGADDSSATFTWRPYGDLGLAGWAADRARP